MLADLVGARRVAQLPRRVLGAAALADVPADVQPGQVAHRERAHREAEVLRSPCRPAAAARLPRAGSPPRASTRRSMRLPMKPSHTPATTPTLLDLLARASSPWRARPSTVFAPRTTSSSFITLAGLKKCSPITSLRALGERRRSRSRRASRCWSRGSRPASSTASSCLNTCFFTAMSSNTASMTMSTSLERRRS